MVLPRDPALDTDRKIAEKFNELKTMIESLRSETLGQNDDWITPTLAGTWADYGSGYAACQYMKDALGFVHIKGLVTGGAAPPTTIFTLPAGYRPLEHLIFATPSFDAFGETRVLSNGGVYARTGNSTWVALDGIVFLAEQ